MSQADKLHRAHTSKPQQIPANDKEKEQPPNVNLKQQQREWHPSQHSTHQQ
jgi:hypothetical protein